MSKLSEAARALKKLSEENGVDLDEAVEGAEAFIADTISEVLKGDYDFNEREASFRIGMCCGSLMEISSVTLEEVERDIIQVII